MGRQKGGDDQQKLLRAASTTTSARIIQEGFTAAAETIATTAAAKPHGVDDPRRLIVVPAVFKQVDHQQQQQKQQQHEWQQRQQQQQEQYKQQQQQQQRGTNLPGGPLLDFDTKGAPKPVPGGPPREVSGGGGPAAAAVETTDDAVQAAALTATAAPLPAAVQAAAAVTAASASVKELGWSPNISSCKDPISSRSFPRLRLSSSNSSRCAKTASGLLASAAARAELHAARAAAGAAACSVMVISGQWKSRVGRILQVDKMRNAIAIEGVKERLLKDSEGREVRVAGLIHVSNAMLLDPVTEKPTRLALRRDDKGLPVRISRRSGVIVPWPDASLVATDTSRGSVEYLRTKQQQQQQQRHRQRDMDTALPGPKDTSKEKALEKTYNYAKEVATMDAIRHMMTKYNRDIQ
ncbi:hypothetical protein Emed_002644 [Eimeria media]